MYKVHCAAIKGLNEDAEVLDMLTKFSNSTKWNDFHIIILDNGQVYIYEDGETRLLTQADPVMFRKIIGNVKNPKES